MPYSLDPEAVKPNTVIVNKPEIPVSWYGIKETSKIPPAKSGDKARTSKLSQEIESE
jgi:hypothetical protein